MLYNKFTFEYNSIENQWGFWYMKHSKIDNNFIKGLFSKVVPRAKKSSETYYSYKLGGQGEEMVTVTKR